MDQDINPPVVRAKPVGAVEPTVTDLAQPTEEDLRSAMELLFYAYRDFTAEPDAILADFGFGRAHHRVIYFTGRNPGIAVSELLGILKITKQSLSRVLSQLIEENHIVQKTDETDRRRRLLFLTDKGKDLEEQLTQRQGRRIAQAYEQAGGEAVQGFCKVLRGIVNREDRRRLPMGQGQ